MATSRKKREVDGKRYIFTYAVLMRGLWTAIDQLEEEWVHGMTAILYCAFVLEAYLNHIGHRKIPADEWEKVERREPKEKLKRIAEEIGCDPDLGAEPFQSFHSIFQFRNALAHGKTTTLEYEQEQYLAEGESPSVPLAEWETQLTGPGKAQRLYEHTLAMLQELHTAAGLEHELFPFSSVGIARTKTDGKGRFD